MDFLLIFFLTLLNGAFAMSELALASSKKSRLQRMADNGDKGAGAAAKLLDDPTAFLSSVQVGITSIGILNGIVGEAAFSGDVAQLLVGIGVPHGSAPIMATALVVAAITFVTIVFGELVPKRIGQLFPEAVARYVAIPMTVVAKVAHPFVVLLSSTTHFVLNLLRVNSRAEQVVTEEEIEASLAEGLGAGVIEVNEHQMVRNVFALDKRSLSSIMLPRSDIHWLDASDDLEVGLEKARALGHSWYPICKGGLDDVVGVLHMAEMLRLRRRDAHTTLGQHAQPAVYVPETLNGMELLEQYRVAAMRMVFVVDEYGVVQGLLTPLDLLEAITGELKSEEAVDTWATEQPDGSWVLDGAMPASEVKARLQVEALPDEDKGRYNTLAGLLQYVSGELLVTGDFVSIDRWRFSVTLVHGRRIDQIIATPVDVDIQMTTLGE
ncbi:hemolysin family protein [Comamonadaceae bacterium M7527]|nr:hemolysin family protein [Comamonadaceae bacterium M7527]